MRHFIEPLSIIDFFKPGNCLVFIIKLLTTSPSRHWSSIVSINEGYSSIGRKTGVKLTSPIWCSTKSLWPTPGLFPLPRHPASPHVLCAYDQQRLEEGYELHSDNLPDLQDLSVAKQYNHFLQDIVGEGCPDPDVEFIEDWCYFVVDFQGWSRHCIPLWVACEYYVLFTLTISEVFTFPRLFHLESMWNPWNPSGIPYGIHGMNVGWDPSQFLIPWTSWLPCGMKMEWSIPHGFHMGSTWIPLDSIWNAGISHPGFHGPVHMDSMEHIQFHGISAGIPREQAYLITKNSGNIENRTPASMKYHVIGQMKTLSATLCNRLKVRM